MPGKLGRTTEQRLAILRNQASCLLWYGKLDTTAARAKELKSYVEKIITKAIDSYTDTIEFEKTVKTAVKDKKGKPTGEIKDVVIKSVKDGPKKLAARRAVMAKLYNIQENKPFKESKSAYKARTSEVKYPLIEKLFNEIAPKYADRANELGQGGGYTRVYLTGERRGDASETAIIELV